MLRFEKFNTYGEGGWVVSVRPTVSSARTAKEDGPPCPACIAKDHGSCYNARHHWQDCPWSADGEIADAQIDAQRKRSEPLPPPHGVAVVPAYTFMEQASSVLETAGRGRAELLARWRRHLRGAEKPLAAAERLARMMARLEAQGFPGPASPVAATSEEGARKEAATASPEAEAAPPAWSRPSVSEWFAASCVRSSLVGALHLELPSARTTSCARLAAATESETCSSISEEGDPAESLCFSDDGSEQVFWCGATLPESLGSDSDSGGFP